RMVPRRSPFFSPPTSLPGSHRSEARKVQPRRCRPNDPLPQLRPQTLDQFGRKSAGRLNSLHAERCGRRSLCSGWAPQQGARGGISHQAPCGEDPCRRTGTHAAQVGIEKLSDLAEDMMISFAPLRLDMPPILDREEYIEQAYFFRTLRER